MKYKTAIKYIKVKFTTKYTGGKFPSILFSIIGLNGPIRYLAQHNHLKDDITFLLIPSSSVVSWMFEEPRLAAWKLTYPGRC